MTKFKILTVLFINCVVLGSLRAENMEYCENAIREMLLIKSYPQKAKIFTQLKPECAKNEKGKIVLKILMYANKNNDPADSGRGGMIKAIIQNGPRLFCMHEDIKSLVKIIDTRVALRLEEDIGEIGYFDLDEKICKKISG